MDIKYCCPLKNNILFFTKQFLHSMAVLYYFDLNKVYVLSVPTERTKELCAWALF